MSNVAWLLELCCQLRRGEGGGPIQPGIDIPGHEWFTDDGMHTGVCCEKFTHARWTWLLTLTEPNTQQHYSLTALPSVHYFVRLQATTDRSQAEISAEISTVVAQSIPHAEITHLTCHILDARLTAEITILMLDDSLTIAQARKLAAQAQKDILKVSPTLELFPHTMVVHLLFLFAFAVACQERQGYRRSWLTPRGLVVTEFSEAASRR